ncbi:hypothetical protein ABGB07_20705 [Micromonosporaceae bacterium B7E4]
MKIADVKVTHDDLALKVRTRVRLSVRPYSRRLAEEHEQFVRRWNLRYVHEKSQLEFLRDHVFADQSLSYIWWLTQHPETILSGSVEDLEKKLAAVRLPASPQTLTSTGGVLGIIADLASWLDSDDRDALSAIVLLDRLLLAYGLEELRERLHQAKPGLPATPRMANNLAGTEQ